MPPWKGHRGMPTGLEPARWQAHVACLWGGCDPGTSAPGPHHGKARAAASPGLVEVMPPWKGHHGMPTGLEPARWQAHVAPPGTLCSFTGLQNAQRWLPRLRSSHSREGRGSRPETAAPGQRRRGLQPRDAARLPWGRASGTVSLPGCGAHTRVGAV